jgi:hypothetical protein
LDQTLIVTVSIACHSSLKLHDLNQMTLIYCVPTSSIYKNKAEYMKSGRAWYSTLAQADSQAFVVPKGAVFGNTLA